MEQLIDNIEVLITANSFNEIKEIVDNNFSTVKYSEINENILILLGSYNRITKKYSIFGDFDEYDRDCKKITIGFINMLTELKKLLKEDEDKKFIKNIDSPVLPKEDFRNQNDLLNPFWLESLHKISKNVCQIKNSDSSGTGIYLQKNTLVTASFVFKEKDSISKSHANFNYEQNKSNFLEMTINLPFKKLKYTSKNINQGISLIELEENNFSKELIDIEISKKRPEVGDTLIVIQHPLGGPKKIELYAKVLEILENEIIYEANTSPGSSGSPVFNLDLKLVGIHFRSVYKGFANVKGFKPIDLFYTALIENGLTFN